VEPYLKTFSDRVGDWLAAGSPESDVVVSTRIRLARNVAGYPFVARLKGEQAAELAQVLRERILGSGFAEEAAYYSLREASQVCRDLFKERHLISRELAAANAKWERGVAFGRGETVGVMVNEEDHLRIQVLLPGLALDAAWERMERADRALGERIEYAFHADFGFLTACPTNVGTGLRVSVMVHLPGLGMAEREMKRVFNAAAKTNLAVRGLHGEGTRATGDFYQISNQITLGRSELEILEDLRRMVPHILKYERDVRTHLLRDQRSSIEDRIWRAIGLLRSARSITTDEAIGHLSAVRLGVHLGLLPDLDAGAVNRLLVLTQPGHLQARAGKELEAAERDVQRAALLRRVLDGGNGR
jgi:protein arginine kinase